MSFQHTSARDDEYERATRGAGWIDRRSRGRVRLEGRDASSFLHALVSNDVASLHAGEGVYATYLTPQGRMVTDLRIHHLGDHLLVDVVPAVTGALLTRFDQAIFAEDVRLTDVSASLSQIAVFGARAASVLADGLSIDAERLEALPVLSHVATGDVVVVRTDDLSVPGFELFLPAASWDEVADRLDRAGAAAMSADVFDVLRIEAGRPLFGVDMTEETIPLEAGLLDRAISMTKGCYIGQEVIVRVLHRGGGRVAKRLVTLAFDAPLTEPPPAGTPLSAGDREIGRVTSAAWSPGRSHVVALGYVHRNVAEIGGEVAAGTHTARITALAG